MKKLLLATIFVLTAFCVCNSKTKDTSVEKEHVSQVKKSTIGLVIGENGLRSLRIGMKRSQIAKKIQGLYDSFSVDENEIEGILELSFMKNGKVVITGSLDGNGAIETLTFYIPNAMSADKKLRIGMKVSEAMMRDSYSIVRYYYYPLMMETPNGHFSFTISETDITKATLNKFYAHEGEEEFRIKATPSMIKPNAKVSCIIVK